MWSPLIIRNVFVGITRFEDQQRVLGISRKVLAERLDWLVQNEVVEKRAYSERPPRYDCVLTQKGQELADVLLAISAWGDRWTAGDAGPPVLYRHRGCGEMTHAEIRCAAWASRSTQTTSTSCQGRAPSRPPPSRRQLRSSRGAARRGFARSPRACRRRGGRRSRG